jgi:hypothetical protein
MSLSCALSLVEFYPSLLSHLLSTFVVTHNQHESLTNVVVIGVVNFCKSGILLSCWEVKKRNM